MYRIACLRIPKFQIAVHQKHEPVLKGKPFVLLAGGSEGGEQASLRSIARCGVAPRRSTAAQSPSAGSARAKVFMCSAEAYRQEVREGMRLSEARGVCADLIWREYAPPLYLDAQRKLLRTLITCSPKVTALETGIFLLDASGLKYLGGEGQLCRHVLKACSQSGFTDGHIGIANSAFAAMVATRLKRKRWYIVPAEKDAEFLAPLPIQHLPLSLEVLESLLDLGIKSIGQLTGLSLTSLEERFGQEGVLAYELAHGKDNRRPYLPELEREFQSSVELGGPVDALNEILFVLKSMLDRLMTQLQQEGLWAEELVLSLYNDNDKFDERPIKLIRPSNHTKFLLEVVKLSLEARPVKREITGVKLAVSRVAPESWEQVPIDPGDAPATLSESLSLLLQRFTTRLGEDAVVRPVANDQYFPEDAGVWLPVLQNAPTRPVLPIDTEYLNTYSTGIGDGLVLRSTGHIPALMELEDSSLVAISYHGQWHRVKALTVPERLSGMWWETPAQRSYYMALISDEHAHDTNNRLVLIIRDHQTNKWFLAGNYD